MHAAAARLFVTAGIWGELYCADVALLQPLGGRQGGLSADEFASITPDSTVERPANINPISQPLSL